MGGALVPVAAVAALLGAPAALAASGVQPASTVPRTEVFNLNDALPGNPDLLRHLFWLESGQVQSPSGDLRVATFSAGLSRSAPGELAEDLSAPGDTQGMQVAETVQRAAPDVVLLTDFDVDGGEDAAQSFRTNYLAIGTGGQKGIDYPYLYVADVNNGLDTGADLDNDGVIGGAGDAYGPGKFPGQQGMVLYSRHPLDTGGIRTFQELQWDAMPQNAIPEDTFTDLERSVLRLSSSSHWDIPVQVDGETVHILAAQPSRSGDGIAGAERHHDEMRFWADYIQGDAGYAQDDQGRTGGLPEGEQFVLAGDFGPLTGTDLYGAENAHPSGIARLLAAKAVRDPQPTSSGAQLLASNETDLKSTATEVVGRDHGEFELARSDYVLPSSTLSSTAAGVFWPLPGQVGAHLTNVQAPGGEPGEPNSSTPSEHRLVWTDVVFSASEGDSAAGSGN
jgi:Endonuclease/Exonuclease/phosphatase family